MKTGKTSINNSKGIPSNNICNELKAMGVNKDAPYIIKCDNGVSELLLQNVISDLQQEGYYRIVFQEAIDDAVIEGEVPVGSASREESSN